MFHYAHAYAASAMTLNEVGVDTIHADAPVRFLFSHAIELYLKAYLLLKGLTVDELRSRALGHNLKKLASKSVKLGLSVSNEQRKWIVLANEAILDRYIETGSRTVLLPESLSEICQSLHEQIGSAVYQQRGLARQPKPFRTP
jgi:HEPN domain-containing protein